MHDLAPEELWLDKSIIDDAKTLADVKRYVAQMYMGLKDQERRLKLVTPEQLAIADAKFWSFGHDLNEIRSAVIVVIEELQSLSELGEGEEDILEPHLVALKAHNQEEINAHIKKRESERREAYENSKDSESSGSTEDGGTE